MAIFFISKGLSLILTIESFLSKKKQLLFVTKLNINVRFRTYLGLTPKNIHVSEAYNHRGVPLRGVIVVNDEDKQRIEKRISNLKEQGIETTEVVPVETETERQGRDFDGDTVGFTRASNFPLLTKEIKQRNNPENAYAPIKKEEKVSFYFNDGTQPPFEEIALFMSDSISVGIINNHATAIEALESEIDILNNFGTNEQNCSLD